MINKAKKLLLFSVVVISMQPFFNRKYANIRTQLVKNCLNLFIISKDKFIYYRITLKIQKTHNEQ
jgi:hypothetical protein